METFLGMEAFFPPVPTLCYKNIRLHSKTTVVLACRVASNSALRKFRQDKLMALSTKLVDGRAC